MKMAKFNYYFGASASALLLAVLVIATELIAPFKNFLKAAFTHHWVGKAAIIVIAFLAFGFILRDRNSVCHIRDDKLAWYSVLGSLIVIFLFFAVEFLK